MLAPDGTLLCRCAHDKLEWYVSRGLAIVESTDQYAFRLTFQPKGMGNANQPFYLSEKHNRCVVCGSEENLTQHHCVPRCFRRNFPPAYKYNTSHDVLPVCIPCHHAYEPYAFEVKQQLAHSAGVLLDVSVPMNQEHNRVIKCAIALHRHSDKIPEPKRQELLQTLRTFYGKEDITSEDIAEACELEGGRPASADNACFQKIVEAANLDEFVVMWRQHFVSTMNPQFLPDHWSVNYETKRVG